MSTFHSLPSAGVPTFTAESANLSLSGLDDLDLAGVMDPYHHASNPHPYPKLHAPTTLSSAVEPFPASVAFGFPSLAAAADDDAFGTSLLVPPPHFISRPSLLLHAVIGKIRNAVIVALSRLHSFSFLLGLVSHPTAFSMASLR